MLYIDLDGTIADFGASMIDRINRKEGTSYIHADIKTWDLRDVLPAGKTWDDYTDLGFWLNMQPLPWARELLSAAWDAYGVHGWMAFLTSSPPSSIACRAEWLDNTFGDLLPCKVSDMLIWAEKKKFVVKKDDILIDDKNDFVLQGLPTLLLEQPYNYINHPDLSAYARRMANHCCRRTASDIVWLLKHPHYMQEWRDFYEEHREEFTRRR